MLEEFITSALVIDDSKSEVQRLIEYLEEKDIWVKHFTPEELQNRKTPLNNRKVIFLDLYLNDKKKIEDNIANIRKYFTTILGNNYGTYGIVLWTKHVDEAANFSERIYKTAAKYTPPLFIIALEKNEYITKNNYNGILEKLEEKLSQDLSSSFFIEWNKAVKQGSDSTISTLYNLFDTNDKKNRHLESVLYSLACNYTGIPKGGRLKYDFQKDLVKSLMDTLQFEICDSFQNITNLFLDENKLTYNDTVDEKTKVFAKLNSLLLLDSQNLYQDSVIPGNIYEVIDKTSPLYIDQFYDKKNNEIDVAHDNEYKDLNIRRICIEVTPPCDFSQNKKQLYSRVVGGIQMDYNMTILKGEKSPFIRESFYKFLYPIMVEGFDKPQMIVFDFYRFQTIREETLKNTTNFKIIIKAKDKLFADILQKLSSHTARFGLSILYP